MAQAAGKLPLSEKISYGFGDLASNFVWGMTTSYLLYFYTNVYGLAATAIGTLFLITRILDAVIDPVIGVMIDKTSSRFGKARPFILFLTIPFAIFSVLTFITPDWSEGGKLIYAYLTYLILGILYSGVNLPYGALMPMMTKDPEEKNQLSSFRIMGMAIGAIAVSALTNPLVKWIGGGNDRLGFPITMGIFTVVAVVMFYVVFLKCKERFSESAEKTKEFSTLTSAKHMLGNQPWVMIALNSLFMFLRIGVVFGVLVFFVQYVLGQPEMIPLYLTLANVANFAGGALAPFVLRRLGKRNGSIVALTVAVLLYGILFFLESSPPFLYLAIFFIANIGIGINSPANFSMLADTVDYHEWKFGHRSEGMLYSAYSFATKFGIAVGGSVVAYALGFAGYDPDAVTSQATDMIRILFYLGPILLTILQIGCLVLYKLDKEHKQIVQDLDLRTSSAEA
ncbi:GPH family glycoside/pentoside/hexuronide:cation symporter [Paenibacillus rhizosphaerae]|uniref:GPH family glycoside/pentoside/hexuronide:cation symporter n=1 Tax=Paenibacillus rhizosphaerae TaxID=297318 RepID=A0A839TFK3_9BACL|nr:MFS transporter [Paenibacillus rhizosphaerae]MBB3125575.1 GPH family glycoside/pentoside/hexuronide:cation symporter [Paenibacillus rhizosphaerae]